MDVHRSKGHILIVDDEPSWREFSRVTLTNSGYFVRTAATLDQALGLLHGDGYDLVVINSEVLVPEGKAFLQELTAYCRHARLVVMSEPFLSRTRALAEARAAYKLGAQDWITKPMGRQPLINLFETLLPTGWVRTGA